MTLDPETLPELLERGAMGSAELTILSPGTDERIRSYDELIERGRTGARALATRGIEAGDRVAMFATTSIEFVQGCLTVWSLGATVVSLIPASKFVAHDVWREQTAARLRTAAPTALLVDEQDRLDLGLPTITFAELESAPEAAIGGPEPETPALIQFTSGTTGVPRGIVLSHRAVCAQLVGIRRWREPFLQDDEQSLSWMPLSHDFGLLPALFFPFSMGEPVTLMSPEAFLADPGCWLLEISRRGATQSHAPAFAYGLAARTIARGVKEPIDLSRWTFACCGSETVDPATLDAFVAAAEPHGFDPRSLIVSFGLAECTCGVTLQVPRTRVRVDEIDRTALGSGRAEPVASDADSVARYVSTGPAMPGHSLRIVDRDGEPVGERRVGEIEVQGPSLMSGYIGDEAGTQEAFTSDGWLRTGDLGYLADGELYVTGRRKDVIIVRGQNFFPEDIEHIVHRVGGIRKGCCVAIPTRRASTEAIVILAEVKPEHEEELTRCRKEVGGSVFRELGVAPYKVVLLRPRSLPKTTSGKLMRGAARELFEAGKLIDVDAARAEATLSGGS